jgi:hypothetical protein
MRWTPRRQFELASYYFVPFDSFIVIINCLKKINRIDKNLLHLQRVSHRRRMN